MRRGRAFGGALLGWLRGLFALSSPGVRRVAAMVVDAVIVLESLVLALLFLFEARFDAQVPEYFWNRFWPFSAFSAVVFVVFLFEGRVYRNVLRYTGVYQGVRVASATAMASGVLLVVNLAVGAVWAQPVPLSVILVGGVLAFVQLVAVRLYPRVFYELSLREIKQSSQRALIVGVDEAGVSLARQLWRTPDAELTPVGFVDQSDGRLSGGQI